GLMIDSRAGIDRAGHYGPTHRSLGGVVAQALVAVDHRQRLALPDVGAQPCVKQPNAARIGRTNVDTTLGVELDLARKLDHGFNRTRPDAVHCDPRRSDDLWRNLDEL